MQTFSYTVRKVPKYGVFSGPYFRVFGLITRDTPYVSAFSQNAWKYGPEKTPYLNTFHAVLFHIWSRITYNHSPNGAISVYLNGIKFGG